MTNATRVGQESLSGLNEVGQINSNFESKKRRGHVREFERESYGGKVDQPGPSRSWGRKRVKVWRPKQVKPDSPRIRLPESQLQSVPEGSEKKEEEVVRVSHGVEVEMSESEMVYREVVAEGREEADFDDSSVGTHSDVEGELVNEAQALTRGEMYSNEEVSKVVRDNGSRQKK